MKTDCSEQNKVQIYINKNLVENIANRKIMQCFKSAPASGQIILA